MKVRSLLQSFLGLPLTIIALIFIGKIFYDNRESITTSLKNADLLLFFVGTILFSSFFALKAYIWTLILERRGYESKKRATAFAYSLAEIKRYIPGGIFAIVGRLNIRSYDIPKKETLKGIGIEAILLASSAFLVSIPAIYHTLWNFNHDLILPLNLLLSLLLVIGIFLCLKFRKYFLSYANLFFLYLAAWFLYGLGCLFTLLSFSFLNPETVLMTVSIFILSWLAGYLFFIAPMGLGVREVVSTFLLSTVVAFPIATGVSIFSRLNMTIGELIFLMVSYVISRITEKSRLINIDRHFLLILVMAFVYFIFFTSFSFIRHDKFLSGRFDLGNMSQTVWNTANGNFFMLTNPDGIENVSRLAVHSDFILIFFAPFYLIWSDPKMLLLIQTLILSSGGFFVYLISKSILKNKNLSSIIALSYYLNFWLHEQNLFDFHAVTLATTFLLGAFYFLLKKNYWLFFLFLFFAVITKENVFLIASIFGLYFVFREKKVLMGILLTVIPFFIFYYLTSHAIPGVRGEAHFALGTYSYLGSSLGEVILNIFLKPQIVFSQLFNWSTFIYFFNHLIPTGFLALLSPVYLLFTIPEMAIYLLSSNYEYRSYEYHFGALFLPFIFIATVHGIKFLRVKFGKKILTVFTYYLLGSSILSMYLYSPIPGMMRADNSIFFQNNSFVIKKYLGIIPPDASVASSNNLGAHLSHRKSIYVVPFGITTADYVVLFGDDGKFKEMVDTYNYEILINDKDNNFIMFKKRIKISCSSCIP